jgi:hypothetical protein
MSPFRITPRRIALAIVISVFASTGVAYAASVGLSSKKLHAWSQTLAKGTCTPTESDATIQAGSPDSNFGNQATLTVRPSWTIFSFQLVKPDDALVQFSPSSCGIPTTGGVDKATLTLTVTARSGGPDTLTAYPITSAWTATTVTWNTAPSVGTTSDFTFSSATGTYTFPVTAELDTAIKSGHFYGWEIVDSANANASATLGGSASAQAPSLSLSYEK